jgi:hypothetical protein
MIGASVAALEDRALPTGAARFVGDIACIGEGATG